jgi:hypothetical protein
MTGMPLYEALHKVALNNPIPERCEVTTAIFTNNQVMDDIILKYREGTLPTKEIPVDEYRRI